MTKKNLSNLHLKVNDEMGFTLNSKHQLLAQLNITTAHLPEEESPKPCFHPIYTPSGQLISEYRPDDHRWHTGLFFGWVHVNDTNFWGGSWYLPENNQYVAVPNSHGIQKHDEFTPVIHLEKGVAIGEKLTWIDRHKKSIVMENRRYVFLETEINGACIWLIESEITPIAGEIVLGASRAAKYSGLVLRMGPPFADAFHTSSSGLRGHESIMRSKNKWVSAAGASGGMVVMMDHPHNPGYPGSWFTRKNLLGSGFLMDGDLVLSQSETLHLRYGFLVVDNVLDENSIGHLYQTYLNESESLKTQFQT